MRHLTVLVFGLFLCVHVSANIGFQSICDSLYIVPDQDSLRICEGTSVQLEVVNMTDMSWDYSWEPAGDFDNPNIGNPTLTPTQSQWYSVTGISGDSSCTDSIYVSLIDPVFEVQVSHTEEDTICPETRVEVLLLANEEIQSITWIPDDGIVNPGATDTVIIRPLRTEEYIVTAQFGNCTRSDTFTLNVIPFELNVLTGDSIFQCLPDTDEIRVSVTPPDNGIVWSPQDTTIIVQPSNTQATVFPTVTTDYTVYSEFMGCELKRTIHVRVDSLPELNLAVIPEKDPYCAGDEVIIFGPDADTMKYPDLEYQWMPMDGQILDSTNTGNVYIVTRDTTTFIRFVRNNACEDSSQITLNVVPPLVPISVTDTTLCPGDQFQVEVLDPDVEDLEWTPGQGLSCTECPDPVVTVQPGGTEYMVMGMKDGCPVGNMLSVNVFPPLPIVFDPAFIEGCPGDMLEINIDITGLTNLQLSVSGGSSLSCDDCPNPVLTIGGPGQFTAVAEENVEDACGALGQFAINILPDEEVFGGSFTVCANEATEIDLSGMGFENPRLQINNGNLSCDDCLNPTITGLDVPTTLIVTSDEVSSPEFCQKRTTFTIEVPVGGDEAVIVVNPSFPGQGSPVELMLDANPPPDPMSNFAWVINGSPDDMSDQTITSILNEEQNMVSVSWTNSFGCIQTIDTLIITSPPDFKIPNAFTPNGDEANETFRVELMGNVTVDEMLIFNRWGQLVYSDNDPDGWDGMFNGEPAPPEVYGYLIKLQFPNGTRTFKGDLTLIR